VLKLPKVQGGILVRSLTGLCGFFEFWKTRRFCFFKSSRNQRTGGSSSSKNKFKIKESWVPVISNTLQELAVLRLVFWLFNFFWESWLYTRVVSNVTLCFTPPLSHLLWPPIYPLFRFYLQSKEILLNLGMKCWNLAFNAQGSGVIIVHVLVPVIKSGYEMLKFSI